MTKAASSVNAHAVVRALCAEFEIEIIPSNEQPKPGQTRAVETMRRILDKHGEPHLRMVLSTLAETKGNQGLMTMTSLWAVSDLVIACAEWIEEDASSWLQAWDAIPLGWTLWHCMQLAGIVNQRHALAGAVYLLLLQHRKLTGEGKAVNYGFLRRVDPEEGMMSPGALRRAEEQARVIEVGNQLLAVKASLPRGAFMKWVETELKIPHHTAARYMRSADTEPAQAEAA